MFTNLTPEAVEPAIIKRDELLDNGQFSAPSSEGKVAVVISPVMNNSRVSETQERALVREGLAISDTLKAAGRIVEQALNPTIGDMNSILTDPRISDICVIGEGAIGCLYVAESGSKLNSGAAYDWMDVSRESDHLKQGSVYQRMCSVVAYSKVIWGTFAARHLENIWVSRDKYLNPKGLHTDPRQGLMTVYNSEDVITYEGLVSLGRELNSR